MTPLIKGGKDIGLYGSVRGGGCRHDDNRLSSSNTSRSSVERSPSRYGSSTNVSGSALYWSPKPRPKVCGFTYKSGSQHGRREGGLVTETRIRAYMPPYMSAMIVLCCVVFLTGTASAEVTQFRPGGLIEWLFNVVAWGIVDITAAIPDLVYLFLLMGLGYILYKLVFK